MMLSVAELGPHVQPSNWLVAQIFWEIWVARAPFPQYVSDNSTPRTKFCPGWNCRQQTNICKRQSRLGIGHLRTQLRQCTRRQNTAQIQILTIQQIPTFNNFVVANYSAPVAPLCTIANQLHRLYSYRLFQMDYVADPSSCGVVGLAKDCRRSAAEAPKLTSITATGHIP